MLNFDLVSRLYAGVISAAVSMRIMDVQIKSILARNLAELGFVVDATVTVVNEIAGNLIIQVKESRIALDKTMANRIMIG